MKNKLGKKFNIKCTHKQMARHKKPVWTKQNKKKYISHTANTQGFF